jgi:hypothetical protein
VKIFLTLILHLVIFWSSLTQAEQPVVGRAAAAKYFQKRSPAQNPFSSADSHYLALHLGKYMNTQSYEWSKVGQEDGVGEKNIGLTYRMGEWQNSMDLNLRVDFADFLLSGESASKISFMEVVTFPDAAAKFPLYFGAGHGLGFFTKQIEKKSPISFDYQLILGARFFEVFESAGFFIEAGLKNHFHLLSSGQLNGTFLASGLVFTF